MTEEVLRQKFPDFLKKCWEIGVGPGWMSLVENILLAMQEECKQSNVQFRVLQIKQKFAGMRFYFDAEVPDWESQASYNRIWQLVQDGCASSYKTCEQCGSPGQMRNRNGWYSTLCDGCDNADRTLRAE